MRTVIAALALAVSTGFAGGARAQGAEAQDPKGAFEKLKALAGDWKGTTTTPDGPPVEVKFMVVSAGSVIEEVQFPGTSHEMRSLYHMDGPDLVLTHYCALGNQPKMRLRPGKEGGDALFFDFAGGTNFDPAKDMHVHSGRIKLLGADRIESEWSVYNGIEPAGSNLFFLTRTR